MAAKIEVITENGRKLVYTGKMAEHSLLYLAGLGFLDDLVEQADNGS